MSTPARPIAVAVPRGRATAPSRQAAAATRHSHAGSAPSRPWRSRHGTVRAVRRARASRQRRAACHAHSRPSASGTASSHKAPGAA